MGALDLGVLALGTVPAKSVRRGASEVNVDLEFGGVRWSPDDLLFADADGVLLLSGAAAAQAALPGGPR